MDKGVINMGVGDIAREFVKDDLIASVGEVCTDAKVNVATVHFSLAYMIAESIADEATDPRDIGCSIMSIQQFMMQVATHVYTSKNPERPN